MILMGERRAEERHDPVAHDLVHGALVAVDGLHHAFEHGVEELLRILGVAVGKQLHRALDIGEQHGDLLALTLEGCPGGEDLVGKVLGRVSSGETKRGIAATGRQRASRIGGRTWLRRTRSCRSERRRAPAASAHCSQNFASAAFSCSQLGHFIARPGPNSGYVARVACGRPATRHMFSFARQGRRREDARPQTERGEPHGEGAGDGARGGKRRRRTARSARAVAPNAPRRPDGSRRVLASPCAWPSRGAAGD